MTVSVKLFAAARQLAGCDAVELMLPEGATVGELRSRLREQVPALAALVDRSMVAVDSQYVSDQTSLAASNEVALIPPVSGG